MIKRGLLLLWLPKCCEAFNNKNLRENVTTKI